MKKTINAVSATILSGAAVSGTFDLGQSRAARIVLPASWTTADLTVKTSPDGVTFNDLYDSTGVEYTIKAAASRAVLLPIADFFGVRFLQFRSGSGASPVNQGADRVLTLMTVQGA